MGSGPRIIHTGFPALADHVHRQTRRSMSVQEADHSASKKIESECATVDEHDREQYLFSRVHSLSLPILLNTAQRPAICNLYGRHRLRFHHGGEHLAPNSQEPKTQESRSVDLVERKKFAQPICQYEPTRCGDTSLIVVTLPPTMFAEARG